MQQPPDGSGGDSSEAGAAGTGGRGGGHMGGASGGDDTGSGGAADGSAGDGGAAGNESGKCPAGFGDCDDNPADCETALDSLTSCGACGVSCSSSHGAVMCQGLACVTTTCDTGFGDCNDSGDDGCETALNTAADCGACGHACGAAGCNVKSYCNATPFASDGLAYRASLSGDAVYRLLTPGGSYGLEGSYKLVRTPLDGSAEVILYSAASPSGVGGMTVDAGFAYWAVGGTPAAVFKKAVTADAATTPTPFFSPLSVPMQLRVQAGTLYFPATDGKIYARSQSAAASDPGTAIVTGLFGTGTPGIYHNDFVTTPAHMYWIVSPNGGSPNAGMLRTAAIAGGAASDVSGAIPKPWSKLAVKDENLYFVQASGSAFDGVYHYAPGSAPEALVLHAGLTNVAVDGTSLYFIEGESKVYKAPITGSAVATLLTVLNVIESSFVGFDAQYGYAVTDFTHGAGFPAATQKSFSFVK